MRRCRPPGKSELWNCGLCWRRKASPSPAQAFQSQAGNASLAQDLLQSNQRTGLESGSIRGGRKVNFPDFVQAWELRLAIENNSFKSTFIVEGDLRLGETCSLAAHVQCAAQFAPPTCGVVPLSGVMLLELKVYAISISWPSGEKLKFVTALRTQDVRKTVPTEDS